MFGLFELLTLIGSLGFFIYGMKLMSDGIQNVAGDRMRQILSAMTSNKFMAVFTGFLITAIVQSSSATTVMVVSFVNAGLLTLKQSIGVIMGANVGTTVTAWIISILGFKVKMSKLALPILALGVPMMFSKKEKVKQWSEVLVGFAFLFMGLQALKEAVPTLSAEQLSFLSDLTGYGRLSVLLFVLVGTLITVIVQSSSAAMALTLVLCSNGILPFEVAAAMVLGENIGTTITANLAAMVGNTAAKRAARAHLIFNVFGVLWMVIVYPWYLQGVEWFMLNNLDLGSPFTPGNAGAVPVALSIFHTSFNIINVLVMINFTSLIERIVTKMIKQEEEPTDTVEEYKLSYVEGDDMLVAEASIEQVKKEMERFGEEVADMSQMAREMLMLNEVQVEKRKELMEEIREKERLLDQMEVQVSNYLIKLQQNATVSSDSTLEIASLMRITHDLERISDLFKSMTFVVEKRYGEIWLTPEEQLEISDYFDLLDEVVELMNTNLKADYGKVSLERAKELEIRVNKKRKKLRKVNLNRSNNDIRNVLAYNELISSVERVGDHVLSVSESVAGVID